MPFSAFGAQTDHFGAIAICSTLSLKSSSKKPSAKSRADAKDEKGDIVASTFYGLTTIYDIECTYLLKSGTMDLSDFMLGLLTVGETAPLLLSLSVKTGNGQWPEITMTGKLGHLLTEIEANSYTFTLPAIDIVGRKMAQEIDFTTGEGCRLNASDASFEISIQEATDGLGVQVAHDIEGGTWKVSGTLVAVTATPSVTISNTHGLVATEVPGIEEPDAAYGTATFAAEGTLTRDAVV